MQMSCNKWILSFFLAVYGTYTETFFLYLIDESTTITSAVYMYLLLDFCSKRDDNVNINSRGISRGIFNYTHTESNFHNSHKVSNVNLTWFLVYRTPNARPKVRRTCCSGHGVFTESRIPLNALIKDSMTVHRYLTNMVCDHTVIVKNPMHLGHFVASQ